MSARKPITIGERFNRWTVIGEAPKRGPLRYVFVRCDCGTEKSANLQSIIYGKSKSCGCYLLDWISSSKTTHGMTGTHVYRVWASMKQRCQDPATKCFVNYGGRGIKVCERWNEFNNFLADMGEAPPGMTLDRIDNNGNYEPSNCRWATASEQARNRRSNRHVTFNGETHTLKVWSELLGFNYGTICTRLWYGWDVERAFTTPIGNR